MWLASIYSIAQTLLGIHCDREATGTGTSYQPPIDGACMHGANLLGH